MGMPLGHAAKHGHAFDGEPSPTYRSWHKMRQRCNNPNYTGYARYGGRGIKHDPHWSDFRKFLADMGERPDGKTLDRIDNEGDYCVANCRWATKAEQDNNKEQTQLWELPDGTVVPQRAAALAMGNHENTLMRWKREGKVLQRDEDKVWLYPQQKTN